MTYARAGEHRWTEAEERQLAELWNLGLSTRNIATALGPHINRDMVIGKAHRLKLPARPSPIKRTLLNRREWRKQYGQQIAAMGK